MVFLSCTRPLLKPFNKMLDKLFSQVAKPEGGCANGIEGWKL